VRYRVVHEDFYFLEWSGTEFTIGESTKGPFVAAPDNDNECGTIGEMLRMEVLSIQRKPTPVLL
jgi:hypothetical protein